MLQCLISLSNPKRVKIGNMAGFVNGVDNLFRHRNRCLVDKFSLSGSVSRDLNPLHIQRWMQSVLWNGIRELDLVIPFIVALPSSSLCTCKTLECLKLEMIAHPDMNFESYMDAPRFEVTAEVSLPNLNVLHLVEITFTDDGSISRMVSKCPVLKGLSSIYGMRTANCVFLVLH